IPAWSGRERRGSSLACRSVPAEGRDRLVPENHETMVGRAPLRHTGPDTDFVAQPAAKPLAALSGLELPSLGPLGFLPVGRSLWIPRSASGRDGSGLRGSGDGPRPDTALGRPPIQRGGRAALVARSFRRRS